MKLMLIVPVVVVGLVLSACGGSSSGSLDTAGPSANGSIDDQSLNGMVKGSTSSDSAPLSADQADQKAQDRCLELGAEEISPEAMLEALRNREVRVFTEMLRMRSLGLGKSDCVGERQGGASCDPREYQLVAFQRAKSNGEAEVLRCKLGGNGGLFWLRIEAFPGF